MRRLLTMGVILFSSFSIGSLPPGSPDECCKQMTVGDQLYHYVGWDDTSQSQHNCYSNCMYSTDCNPGKRVCFKKEFVTGQKSQEKSVCHDVELPKTAGDQCDRPCFSFFPSLKCVFNFTLEMWKSDVDGRRADGRVRSVLAYNKQIPGPPIVICEGDELVVNFKNNINGNMTNMDGSSEFTTLHFHGIREKTRPWSDGVPFVSQCPITPEGQSHPNNPFPFPYGFNTNVDGAPAGTYWYHSHVGAQRTNGAYGALIIKETLAIAEDIIDDAKNTLVLQEWYESSTNQVPVSLLINGNGRIAELINTGGDEQITAHLTGKGACFNLTKNKHFDAGNFTTNYTEFHVKPGHQYRFRVIGAISQNLPLRLSIENHTFTAIAMDSLNIQPVTDLTDLWLAAGERYDILVNTTEEQDQSGMAYKIKVLGYTDQPHNNCPLCTIAWLIYPNQSINHTYYTDSACTGFDLPSSLRTLNPVPNNYTAWENRIQYPNWTDSSTTGDIFIADLREPKSCSKSTIKTHLANTHYIEFDGNITFNGLRMSYPPVPFLLQDPANETDRCGSECKGYPPNTCTTKNPANCSANDYCPCQHVVKEPLAPGWWVEIVLVNNNQEPQAAAHPIHQHGGWYWVVGEGQYNNSTTVNRHFIMQQDKIKPLPRNFINPPAKDTIQVPPRGYVIIRTKLDNAGTWIFHCHINYHVTIGMAMVLQIGELGKSNLKHQDWSTGPLERNVSCETPPPPPGGGPTTIHWFYGMENAERCVTPGMTVTFNWVNRAHNVNIMSKADYDSCNVTNYKNAPYVGMVPYIGMVPGTYYFACGMFPNIKTPIGIGWHCKHGGMKAKIHVRSVCP